MNRAAAGVIVGFLFMLIAPFIFTEWEVNALMNVSLVSIFGQMSTDLSGALSTWFGLGFHGDGSLFKLFGDFNWFLDANNREIFWMTIMAWFSTAFVIGLVAKGAKRSILVALGVFIVYLSLFLIFAVLSGEDLMTMFTGANLIDQLGVLLTAAVFSVLGGLIGGKVSGAAES